MLSRNPPNAKPHPPECCCGCWLGTGDLPSRAQRATDTISHPRLGLGIHPRACARHALQRLRESPSIPTTVETREATEARTAREREDEFYPAEDEFYPTENEFYPTEDEFYPTKDEFYPTEDEFYPTKDEFYPTEDEFYSTEDEFYPQK
eukprot:1190117-Prorocentrum_minimum.AAC.1